jgi:peroxiredoxin
MALTPSTFELGIGSRAPDFTLADPDGNEYSRRDFADGKGLLVAFVCNHCPYVVHIREQLGEVADAYQKKGIKFVAINSNDVENYPADSPEKMKEFARESGWDFPYLYDESQDVAKAYKAACTPDFFLFDEDLKLAYSGQFDGSRPGNSLPVDGKDLKTAMDTMLRGQEPMQGLPSNGCNIKWKKGNEPEYFGA